MIASLLGLLSLAASPAAPPAEAGVHLPGPLYIQPMGSCARPDRATERVVTALKELYAIDVRLLPCVELPERAYYPPRRRYRAERLLDFLRKRMPEGGWRILGLTAVDISTTKDQYVDWGVMGLGELPGTASVISSFRCRKKIRDTLHGDERLAKVAVHEVGHTLGLDHCPHRGCLMEDAQGKVNTADRENDLCPSCRARLAAAGMKLPATPAPPWRAPR